MNPTNFPGRKTLRQKEAVERNTNWSQLSLEQQLSELDSRLGEGKGAARQRKRIAQALTLRPVREKLLQIQEPKK